LFSTVYWYLNVSCFLFLLKSFPIFELLCVFSLLAYEGPWYIKEINTALNLYAYSFPSVSWMLNAFSWECSMLIQLNIKYFRAWVMVQVIEYLPSRHAGAVSSYSSTAKSSIILHVFLFLFWIGYFLPLCFYSVFVWVYLKLLSTSTF
jgi:hypothetical protein